MEKLEKNDQLLILETLGFKEFCAISLLAYQEVHFVVVEKLKGLIMEFPLILDQDAKDMLIACENAKKVAWALNQSNAPSRMQQQTSVRVPTSRSHLLKNPMFCTFFFKEEKKSAMDFLLEGKQQSGGAEWRNIQREYSLVSSQKL